MKKKLELLWLLTLLCLCWAAAEEDDHDDEDFGLIQLQERNLYAKINAHLSAKGHETVEESMQLAIEWLKQLESEQNGSRLMEALRQLTALKSADQCDSRGWATVLANDRATDGHAHSAKPSRLVDRLVAHYALKRAQRCQPLYPQLLDSKMKSADGQLIDKLEVFLSNQVLEKLFRLKLSEDASQLYTRRMSDVHLLAGFAKEALGGELSLEKFYPQVVEPCAHLVNLLGADILLPALYDATWKVKVDDNNLDFYRTLARFRVCRVVLENEDALRANLKLR